MLRDDFTSIENDNYTLDAMPGKVIVEYDPPRDQTDSGLYLPERSKREKHVAVVRSVGYPLDAYDRIFVKEVKPGDFVKANPSYGAPHEYVDETGKERKLCVFRMYEVIGKLTPVEKGRASAAEDSDDPS